MGEGWDTHILVPGRPLMLGGVQVPHSMGLMGHSDADALAACHHRCLLGAAGLGDIGRHFPDTDPDFKGADSAVLLAEAMKRVRAAGYELGNLDATVIAQAPKLAPHIPAMCERIAAVLGVALDQVNVKAKTAEKLGPVGQGLAMEARAVVLADAARALKARLRFQRALARRSLMWADRPPVLLLARAKRPPMRAMARSTMARPSPVPVAEVREASPRKNGWVSCSSMSGLTPLPWSRSLISTQSFFDLGRDLDCARRP